MSLFIPYVFEADQLKWFKYEIYAGGKRIASGTARSDGSNDASTGFSIPQLNKLQDEMVVILLNYRRGDNQATEVHSFIMKPFDEAYGMYSLEDMMKVVSAAVALAPLLFENKDWIGEGDTVNSFGDSFYGYDILFKSEGLDVFISTR